ncbi:uncharacterized protein LOC6557245 [Drosophila grimshawi]|uniref:uncharacterized protein LOC6557245 n=1 Tax=Drosophila grimshawi TaxID=7222 RepID=UPI000C870FFC|nr:uncharacterized protein LOC6557245 [Drosophila grimshawi]
MRAFTFAIVGLMVVLGTSAQSLQDQCRGIEYDLIPHPADKKKFIVCVFEVPEERTCANDHCFDPKLKSCSEIACNPIVPSDKAVAVAYCHDLGPAERIPSVDCSHFWICLGDLDPVYVACPDGKHYSRSEQACISPPLAKCTTHEKLCAFPETAFYPAENCNEYYACDKKNLVKHTCLYGQAYSAESTSCVPDFDHSCAAPTKPDCQNPANADAYFSHSDCSKFYVCIQTQVYEGKCANGFGFDRQSSNCMPGICNA